LTVAPVAAILCANKFISKGVEEDEYADARTPENLRQLRRRVSSPAEKDLGAAGRKGKTSRNRSSRPAPVIRLESSS
jgi:hypothetical protein